MGDEGAILRRDQRALLRPPVLLTLQHGIPGDDWAIARWVAHLIELGEDEIVAAIWEAQAFRVRTRVPRVGVPVPQVPRDFRRRFPGER